MSANARRYPGCSPRDDGRMTRGANPQVEGSGSTPGAEVSGELLRPVGSGLSAEPTSRTRPLTCGAKAIQTLDEHWVGLKSSRVVDEGIEHLVVPSGAHIEELANGLFLGAGILPPLALERDDLAVAVAQLTQRLSVDLCRGVHMALRVGCVQGQSYRPNDTVVIHRAVRPTHQ